MMPDQRRNPLPTFEEPNDPIPMRQRNLNDKEN
jgi:hypothetical protein